MRQHFLNQINLVFLNFRSAQKDIGNWERHTKGFGLKMLTKMGWEKGKGLGKEGQGRAVPVEAFVRKGKAAVGMYGAESKEVLEKKLRKFNQGEEEDDEEEEKDLHVSQWKKAWEASSICPPNTTRTVRTCGQ